MKAFFRNNWPIITSIIFLYITIGIILFYSLRNNQATFIYALDDTYIHLSIAKNFSEYGVWGVNNNEFSSSTSSPLWTFIIFLTFKIFSVNEHFPFILNLIISALFLFSSYNILRKYNLSNRLTFLVLLSLIYFFPIPFLIFTGLEHLLHTTLIITYLYIASDLITNYDFYDKQMRFKKSTYVLALTFIIVLIRYESLFFIVPLFILFLLYKKYTIGFLVLLFGLAPVLLYGIVSIINGWYLLPAPILIKSTLPDFSSLSASLKSLGGTSLLNLLGCLPLLILLIVSLILILINYNTNRTLRTTHINFSILFIVGLLFHMQYSVIYERYEAYLIGIGIISVAINSAEIFDNILRNVIKNKNAIPFFLYTISAFFLLLPFLVRGYYSIKNTKISTTNIFEQQYQMASFVKSNLNNEIVAVNDIGLVSFLSKSKCVDLWGISNKEVLSAKLKKIFNTAKVEQIANENNVKIAMVYDKWFEKYGGLPDKWQKIGSWTISNNIICGDSTVTFYSLDTSSTKQLTAMLKGFSSKLPKSVKSTF